MILSGRDNRIKFEKAAMRWLERHLTESSPRLRHFAEVAADLAKRDA